MNTKRKILIVFLVFLLLFVFAMIFRFSSENGVESKSTSRAVTEEITKPIKVIQKLEPNEKEKTLSDINVVIRKIAHFSLYTTVGIIAMCIMTASEIDKEKKRMYASLVIGISYAIFDEIHQMFVDGRSGMITDVFIDTAGVAMGIFIVSVIYKTYLNKIVKNF